MIYKCTVLDVVIGLMSSRSFWVGPGQTVTEVIPPPPPDPRVLAQQAINAMALAPIDIGIVPEDGPDRVGVIGLPTWMWAENPAPNTTGPIDNSQTLAGWTVTVNASVDRTVWTMGDGTTVTCVGAGTPYADAYGTSESPTCGHRYTEPGTYPVSATTYWTARWAGIGESGTIPLEFTSSTQISMGEVQVLNR